MSRAVSNSRLPFWALRSLAVVIILCGLIMAAGGAWLISLDGPWYYLANGAGLIAAGAFLYAQRLAGVALYWIAFIASIAWTVSEVGVDLQLILPRISALGVLGLLTLLFIPMLNRGGPQRPT